MLRFVVLVAFGVASVLAIDKECFQLATPLAARCCKTPPPKPLQDESLKECFEKFKKSPETAAENKCELEQCIAKKIGFLADDGTIDKKAFEARLVEKFKEHPKLVANMINNCVNADVKEYGPESTCELLKVDHCLKVQYGMSCPDLDDKGSCSEIKALAEKCAAE
ncbi:general odorant-binding protein 66-like [Hyposmocoma kahamanoa]|uniref:general odorant-binding protein 66-like n=1 Tax=Hyposmocoma kahamanoa TaxID=1477025 RepID=UPI000E6D5FBE|nr:general odorant-binding protein 66-like [Hyposmocoma kahamanoa]